MSARLPFRFTNSDGTKNLTAVFFQSPDADELQIRVYNDASAAVTYNYLVAMRGDLIGHGLTIPEESETVSNGMGEELVTERWLEASLDGVTWTAIDSWTNKLELGSMAAGSYKQVWLRIAAPASYVSSGMIGFSLGVYSTNALPALSTLFSENFETYDEGDYPDSFFNEAAGDIPPEVVIVAEGYDGNEQKVFTFGGDPLIVSNGAYQRAAFERVSKRYLILDCWFNLLDGSSSALFFALANGVTEDLDTDEKVSLVLAEGRLPIDDKGQLIVSAITVAAFEFSQWHRLTVRLDSTAGTQEIFFNGSRVASGLPLAYNVDVNRATFVGFADRVFIDRVRIFESDSDRLPVGVTI
jgi:hypothetical protein